MRDTVSEAIDNDGEGDARAIVGTAVICSTAMSSTNSFTFENSFKESSDQ